MSIFDTSLAIRGNENKQQMLEWVKTDPSHFTQLMTLVLGPDLKIADQASRIMPECVIPNPTLFVPYIGDVLNRLQAPKLTDSLRLNITRALQYVSIPEEHQGLAADILFGYLANPDIPVAPRCFGMSVLANICADIPELAAELRLIIEEQIPHSSPAFRTRAKQVMKQLNRRK